MDVGQIGLRRFGSYDQAGEPQKSGAILEVKNVTVRFGGLIANDDVTFSVEERQVTSIIGPNGAGKSTMFDVITGARRPQEGHVIFDGRDLAGLPPHARARLGISRTFQNLAIARDMSVHDNVYLGAARFFGYGVPSAIVRLPKVRRQDRLIDKDAAGLIHILGLDKVAGVVVGDLPYGDQRRVEVARALALRPRLVLLDEPAAGMGPSESMDLAAAIRTIAHQWGVTVLVVEHDLDFVRYVADQAVVLDFGKVIATGAAAEVMANEAVQAAYMGKEAERAGAK